jgi:hypothetical protein
VKDAISVMMNDCSKNWTLSQSVETAMQSRSGLLSISGYGARDNEKPAVDLQMLWPPRFEDVLKIGQPHLEARSPAQRPNHLHPSTKSNRFLAELFF